MFTISHRSMVRLNGVHPLLIANVCIALRKYATYDFLIAENNVRTFQQQKQLYDAGYSKTMNSKHLIQEDGYSHAVDLYPCGYKTIESIPNEAWEDLVESMVNASKDVGLKLKAGYYWGWDKPHFEIYKII